MKSQHGFSAILVIVILAVIAAAGLATYWVVMNNRDETSSDSSTSEQSSNVDDQDGYAVIEEWGVKVAMRDYDKFKFKVSEITDTDNLTTFQGVAEPSFKAGVLQDGPCYPGLSFYRSTEQPQEYTSQKVGDYYYTVTGGPGRCNDQDLDSPDNKLQERFFEDFTSSNVSLL